MPEAGTVRSDETSDGSVMNMASIRVIERNERTVTVCCNTGILRDAASISGSEVIERTVGFACRWMRDMSDSVVLIPAYDWPTLHDCIRKVDA
jgi:hypothetical protein